MTFTFKDQNFCLNGKEVFLNSGEIHYFRINREFWDIHLQAAKEAGLRTVSTYVPWAWHESEEGVFDFSGDSCPERDLIGWLQKCQSNGLTCILKPGPFILAEFRGAGLPDWFVNKHGNEVKMRNSKGELLTSDGVNLFHKTYLEKVTLWYDHIMPLIASNQISEGGPIILMQICNEIGVFSWLAHQADYNMEAKIRFITYLKMKFASVDVVNQLWDTDYKRFDDVELPPDGRIPYYSEGDRGRDYEWHCFWRTYYGDYLRKLTEMARERGITVPVYHNLPGWIYGHGYDFPINITMYEDLYRDKSEIIFGIDHIPEFQSHRNMHDDRIINDITLSMQGEKPLFAAEFQCGSREYHVVTNPREMELFYKASIANGLTGWNYYMFSQGRNPRQKGYSGDTFYWFTPVTAEGQRTEMYPLVKRMSNLINNTEDLILNSKRRAAICVLFYPPYYATELDRPETGASGLQFVPATIRRPAYFDGLLKVFQVLNIDYDMADLSKARSEDLNKYKQIWAFCTDEMNAKDQQVIVDYANAGGNVAIFPNLPDREMSQKRCTILRDAIKISPSGSETTDSPLIDVYDLKDIKCANPQIVYSEKSLSDADIIARTLKGTPCGFKKPLGKGTIIHLGTWLGFDTEGHKPVYERILRESGARLRQTLSGNDNISVKQRFTDNETGVLFIGNYYNEEQSGNVTYTHPETGEPITIPYESGTMLWPPLYAVFSPICLEIENGLRILHTTSDLIGIEKHRGYIALTLLGDRDLAGEIVLEGELSKKIKSCTIDGESLNIITNNNRIALRYSHKHVKEIVLKIYVTK
jgi:beta-galactosidase